MLEVTTDSKPYQKFIQDTKIYTVEDGLEDENKKYIVQLVSHDQSKKDIFAEQFKEIKESEELEILYSNENGFVAKIKGR